MRWWDRGACVGEAQSTFYPTAHIGRPFVVKSDMYAAARQICDRCEVRSECLDDALALETGGRYGFVGGMSPDERTKEAVRRKGLGPMVRRRGGTTKPVSPSPGSGAYAGSKDVRETIVTIASRRDLFEVDEVS